MSASLQPARQLPGPGGGPARDALWRGWPEVREDLPTALLLALALAVVGAPIGVLWWVLAPRAQYEVTDTGPIPVGSPSEELRVAGDGVFALLLLAAGLTCGAAAWLLRRRRGVATVVALALGTAAGAVVAWQVGEVLGAGPTQPELAQVGARLTTGLSLGSPPALAVAPFAAVLAYVCCALVSADDGLGRPPAPVRDSVDRHRGGELLQGHGNGAERLEEGQLPAQQP